MYSGRGKLFPGAALADQNYRTERTGNTRNLLLKPKEHFDIFSRFRDIVNSNINSMLDQAEDPEKMIRLIIQEMEETEIEIKASCASAMAARKTAGRNLADRRRQADEWEKRAKLAMEKGREDLAREALLQKHQVLEGSAEAETEIAELEEIIKRSRSEICQLEEKLTGARERQRVLAQRHTQARQRTRSQEQIRKADSHLAIARLEHFEQQIERMEAQADVVNYGKESRETVSGSGTVGTD